MMNKSTWLLCLLFTTSLHAQNNETYFLSQPTLTPDGQTVVFSFEGDLWKAGLNDKQAYRSKQSNFAPSDKPIVLLVNEQSLSDAEMTTQDFKALKLGKIVGNETYHWIIFTGGMGLVDGSTVRMPSWGCYTLEGADIERNGVKPDVLLKHETFGK